MFALCVSEVIDSHQDAHNIIHPGLGGAEKNKMVEMVLKVAEDWLG